MLDSCRVLESEGFEVTYLPVQKNGLVDMDVLRGALHAKTLHLLHGLSFHDALIAQAAIAGGCPDGLRYSFGGNQVCLAPRSFCLDGEYAGDPRRGGICGRLDSEIARCASLYPGQCTPGADRTPQVYACSGGFFAKSELSRMLPVCGTQPPHLVFMRCRK